MDVETTALAIRNMEIRGAGRIGRAGAAALKDLAENHPVVDKDEFYNDLKKSKKILLDSRPTAVSLWNAVHSVMKGVSNCDSYQSMCDTIIHNANSFIQASEAAVAEISKIGAKRIRDGDVIVTHCNSSAAVGVLKEAHRQGKEIHVYATESRPWRQGLITANQLADAGIDVTLIIDSAVRSVMKRADKVFVGADTITSHGALVNKVGTSQVALAAKEARVQFYVCSETYKFSPMSLFGDMVTIEERSKSEVVSEGEIRDSVKIFNPVFDSTPSSYIDAIITEAGMISPGSVYPIMLEKLGREAFIIEEVE